MFGRACKDEPANNLEKTSKGSPKEVSDKFVAQWKRQISSLVATTISNNIVQPILSLVATQASSWAVSSIKNMCMAYKNHREAH